MKNNILNSYFFILFSFIPASIIVGPAVSLANILLIDFSFILLILYKKDFKFLSNKTVKLILLLCLYLVFNSFISKDFSLGVNRNFGFIRFGILFCAFNYFFYHQNSFNRIFVIWVATLTIVAVDTYIESFFGQNILGYKDAHLGQRIVSFFKDEAIVGGYINGFYLVIIGYFLILMGWRFVSVVDFLPIGQAIGATVPFLLLGVLVCAILIGVAWVFAHNTVYTITSARIVMRIGAALTLTLNLPYRELGNASLKLHKDGSGTIALETTGNINLSYLVLWPHARAWRFSPAQPALRCIQDAQNVANILAEAAEDRINTPLITRDKLSFDAMTAEKA